MASRLSPAEIAERFVYRVAGLPVALSAARRGAPRDAGDAAAAIDAAYAAHYWRPGGLGEWLELGGALILWPFAIAGAALWYTALNGAAIRRRSWRGAAAQFADQLRLYFAAGVLPPWYYIFSLDTDGSARRARTFLQRFQTKSLFRLLKVFRGTPLNDKVRFADYCAAHNVRCVPTIAAFDGTTTATDLPNCDLFVKPSKGRGGRGAERWDRVGPWTYEGPGGERLGAPQLLDRLAAQSRHRPLIVQPRLTPHHALADLTTGALSTIRVVTCLDEHDEPEVIGGVFRMSIGANSTVDNFHAGGIAANVSLDSAELSKATNLGSDARLGWLSVHPDTGARIEGRTLPEWDAVKRLASDAHRAFGDRVVIGWDIAILEDGPILIEGNGNSDMDILQRFMATGLRQHRFGELLAFHLRRRGAVPARFWTAPRPPV